MEDEDKVVLIILVSISVAFALMYALLVHDQKKDHYHEKEELLQIYTSKDIYYIDVDNLKVISETGLDTVFNHRNDMYNFIENKTVEDEIHRD